MSAKELLAEIAKMTGLPEEKVEGVISALMERMAEALPPSLTVQLISEIRQLSHQIGRIERGLFEFKASVEVRLDRLERWLFVFLIPILLALLSLVARVFLFSP